MNTNSYDTNPGVTNIKSCDTKPGITKISIVARRNIYHYFVEYIESILYWFDKYDIKSKLVFEDEGDLYEKIEDSNFIICVQLLLLDTNKVRDNIKRIIILNLEQNTRKTYYYQHVLNLLQKGYLILDYHLGNIDFMNKETNGLYQKQILYLPYLYCSKDKILSKKKRSKDVCFVGTITQYRYDLLNELRKEVNVDVITNFGDQRDNILSDYKIILNLHADESYQVFETIRCYRCIFNHILVISEDKKYKENNMIDELCIFSDRKNIVSTIKNTLVNYHKISKEKFNGNKDKVFISWSEDKMKIFLERLNTII
jgi:hypothetical protein